MRYLVQNFTKYPIHILKDVYFVQRWNWAAFRFNSLRPHICVGKRTIIGSNNDLSPERRQALIWTNAGILLIRTLGTNFSEVLGEIHSFSFKKMHLKMSSATWRPFCLGLNVLRTRKCLKQSPEANNNSLAVAIAIWMAQQLRNYPVSADYNRIS